ncbi:MAG: hypothetical protein V8R08_05115 [Coriobacteriales bacterium]
MSRKRAGDSVVAVVSAMGKTTDDLVALAELHFGRSRPARDGHVAVHGRDGLDVIAGHGRR